MRRGLKRYYPTWLPWFERWWDRYDRRMGWECN